MRIPDHRRSRVVVKMLLVLATAIIPGLSAHRIVVGLHYMLFAIVGSLSEPAFFNSIAFDIRISVGRALVKLLLPDAAARLRANSPVTHLPLCLGWSELAEVL